MSSVLTKNIHERYTALLREISTERPMNDTDDLWHMMRSEADAKAAEEPILGSYFHATIKRKEHT